MNRADCQQLAIDRIADAQALLAAKRWSGAFYLVGYAVELGLKSCVLARLAAHPEIIFEDKQKDFSRKCWTHDLEVLLELADLKALRDTDTAANTALRKNWQTLSNWSETARYRPCTQGEADSLFNAVNDPFDLVNGTYGVHQWIIPHW